MTPKTLSHTTPGGIEWYIEQSGSGPHLVLIPSGEGDCEAFCKMIPLLAKNYTVTTFDMPGLSRTKAPISALHGVHAWMLAEQIIGLMDGLGIERASFFGSSKRLGFQLW